MLMHLLHIWFYRQLYFSVSVSSLSSLFPFYNFEKEQNHFCLAFLTKSYFFKDYKIKKITRQPIQFFSCYEDSPPNKHKKPAVQLLKAIETGKKTAAQLPKNNSTTKQQQQFIDVEIVLCIIGAIIDVDIYTMFNMVFSMKLVYIRISSKIFCLIYHKKLINYIT